MLISTAHSDNNIDNNNSSSDSKSSSSSDDVVEKITVQCTRAHTIANQSFFSLSSGSVCLKIKYISYEYAHTNYYLKFERKYRKMHGKYKEKKFNEIMKLHIRSWCSNNKIPNSNEMENMLCSWCTCTHPLYINREKSYKSSIEKHETLPTLMESPPTFKKDMKNHKNIEREKYAFRINLNEFVWKYIDLFKVI